MSKKPDPKNPIAATKLTVARETVRRIDSLSPKDLALVAGGGTHRTRII